MVLQEHAANFAVIKYWWIESIEKATIRKRSKDSCDIHMWALILIMQGLWTSWSDKKLSVRDDTLYWNQKIRLSWPNRFMKLGNLLWFHYAPTRVAFDHERTGPASILLLGKFARDLDHGSWSVKHSERVVDQGKLKFRPKVDWT
jgi:hypothetical protein